MADELGASGGHAPGQRHGDEALGQEALERLVKGPTDASNFRTATHDRVESSAAVVGDEEGQMLWRISEVVNEALIDSGLSLDFLTFYFSYFLTPWYDDMRGT